ncbi:fumarylacetoacetate hydrolase family protein [Novosphingobium flavum]|uniref:Fumarylacetoacetate hydrolase family protein n=2 Tax=Novosphingobium flavum TaxID=1778672 RepID=A0A7X1FST7_9SPHN|nr:fumarylacetoacetate hydrolase family protein [Novosphingobium flavum]MBC2666333.1 fumarylacetoacetate hydrolase family protein [Novosphingobium flavum]
MPTSAHPSQGRPAHISAEASATAEAFVTARRVGLGLDAYPGERPGDLAGAYLIQERAIAFDGRTVMGWKVGRIAPPLVEQLGANRLTGPIFEGTQRLADDGSAPEMPVFADGFAAAEAEFLLHIVPGKADARPADDAATRLLIDEVRLGIEIASSPWRGINADGPAVTASDFGNNHGLVLGPRVENWRELDLQAVEIRTEVAGETVGCATAQTMLDGPLGAVRFLLGHLADRGIDVTAGTWVSSGAVTGVHVVEPGQEVRAVFGDLGEVRCRIVAARPD